MKRRAEEAERIFGLWAAPRLVARRIVTPPILQFFEDDSTLNMMWGLETKVCLAQSVRKGSILVVAFEGFTHT